MKRSLLVLAGISFLCSCGVKYIPADQKDRYTLESDEVDNRIVLDCPCKYLKKWSVAEKYHQNQRSFERNFGQFMVGRIEISYNYYERLYKKSPKLYSDDLEIKHKAWSEQDGDAGGTRQYWNAARRKLKGRKERECVYLEYGTSMHGKPEKEDAKFATGWHQRKLSCPIKETEFRDGLYIAYSLNVFPKHETGDIAAREAMKDVEKTVNKISKRLVFDLNQVKVD